MFGIFSKLLHNKKQPLQAITRHITSQHDKILAEITLEARLLGILNRPNEIEEIKRYYQSVANRYNIALSYLHRQAQTQETLFGMRKLAKGVNEETDIRLVKRLRYRFLEYFTYADHIKKLERKLIDHYAEAIEQFLSENMKLRSSEDISEYLYQPPPPLNTIFSSI